MLSIASREQGKFGEIWIVDRQSEDWIWTFSTLPYLIHQDLGLPPGPYLQQDSDLDLYKMPLYISKVPSVFFFPYVTYFADTWFHNIPSFVIPNTPLNRLKGRYWLDGLASWPFDLINPREEDQFLKLQWVKTDGTPVSDGIDFLKLRQLASAAKTYFLDDIRYVYDESKSTNDGHQTNTPSRYQFKEDIAGFETTKKYLDWYINECFNDFFSHLLAKGKQNDTQSREDYIITGLTVNRLAIDTFTILSSDVPYIRKWQFFSFLDALASLKNRIEGSGNRDADTAKNILQKSFFQTDLLPVLGKIPVKTMRDQIITHTEDIYNAIKDMKTDDKSGPDLLWVYRNSRHGYNIRDVKTLLLHSGKIPDNLPDLCIALWHYVLLGLRFQL